MGEGETGGRITAPIFRDFMRVALRDTQPAPFRIPAGARLVRVDTQTGLLPSATTTSTILEAFRPDTEPTRDVAASPFISAAPIRSIRVCFRVSTPIWQRARSRTSATATAGRAERGFGRVVLAFGCRGSGVGCREG